MASGRTTADLTVEDYLAGLGPPIRELAEAVRELVLSVPGVRERVMWSMPWYESDGGKICYIMGGRGHLTFGFARGTELADDGELLEGMGKGMRHVKIRTEKDINRRQFLAWLRESVALNEGGARAGTARLRSAKRPAESRSTRRPRRAAK